MAQAEAEATASRPNTSGAGPDRGDENPKQRWKVLVGAGAVAVGSWFLFKRMTKKKTKEDHVESVKKLLEGEKVQFSIKVCTLVVRFQLCLVSPCRRDPKLAFL
jgi:hypothetical protein